MVDKPERDSIVLVGSGITTIGRLVDFAITSRVVVPGVESASVGKERSEKLESVPVTEEELGVEAATTREIVADETPRTGDCCEVLSTSSAVGDNVVTVVDELVAAVVLRKRPSIPDQ